MLPYFPWLSAVDIRSTKFSWWWHIITFDFITKRLAGDATSLFTSLMVSTTRGLEFTIAYISIRKVFSDSSSKLVLCVFRIDESIARADFICLSHTLLIWLAKGGFIFHCIQSAFCFSRNSLILL